MSLPDELSRLADLRREGILSEREFADAKKKLLYTHDPEASKPDAKTSSSMGGLLFLPVVCAVVLFWLLGTAPKQLDATRTFYEYDSQGLASSAGRVNIGTRLYSNGKSVGTVLAISDKDPFSGANRNMVLVRFDSSSEPEWKTRDIVKSSFRVK